MDRLPLNQCSLMPTDRPETETSNPRDREPSPAATWLNAINSTSRIEASPARLFADIVEEWAGRQPERTALIGETSTLSYRQLADRINRYARWALSIGIVDGNTVCLLMPGGPDYIAAWLGITKIGGVAALINPRLIGSSLAHCINVAAADHMIVSHELVNVFETAVPGLNAMPRIWRHGEGTGAPDIEPVLAKLDGGPLSASERPTITISDPALLIYTSGTTGLPKAARISHRRILNWGGWFAGLSHATPEDRLYDCLPLCHSVGGIVAPCSMLYAGGSVVLADTFSTGRFWRDIVERDCTLFQYIGELCRYLLKAPPSEFERRHRLRLVCGNGLRGDIWEAFQARFGIPKILEFYAATEGNFSLYNVEGKPGAIGRIPGYLAHRFPAVIIRVDPELGTPIRTADGLCIVCARGEVGEAIGRIGNASGAGGRFEGYTDAAETEKKVLRSVRASGDAWFRTGDLMTLDQAGYFRFVDRVGDTFRWKAENVSATEVNEAVLRFPGVVDAATYGVTIPHADGRAGMVAIVADSRFNLDDLPDHLARCLPSYACPVFVRLCATLDRTETFRQKKRELAREGFDPVGITDAIFFRDATSGAYLRFSPEACLALSNGTLRL